MNNTRVKIEEQKKQTGGGTTTSSCCCATPVGIEREGKMTTNAANTVTLSVPDIVCGGCASSIKKALGNLEGVERVEVDVNAKRVMVEYGATATREKIAAALDKAGYTAS